MHVACDDGSTAVKLAWFEDDKLETFTSLHSFRKGWAVNSGIGKRQLFNFEIANTNYTFGYADSRSLSSTNIEYQYNDLNLLAIHHALLTSGIPLQPVDLTVTLPISEYYNADCQKNTLNIERKIANVLRPIKLNNGECFPIRNVDVMPESLTAIFSAVAKYNVGPMEKSLVIDLGGTTIDNAIILGQFEEITNIHGNSNIGMNLVTKPVMSALQMADSNMSEYMVDEVIRQHNNTDFLKQVINNHAKIPFVLDTMKQAIEQLNKLVINELSDFRDVNRVWIVGGAAEVIEPSIRKNWPIPKEKIIVVPNAQTAQAREIAMYMRQKGS
ncbi:plasmid segregation protein ParM domain-containing protein [Xenorhabdus innexi]|nr:plasmid segregation protein ParM domain-containing protein [Xenorhabdus innexi]